MSDLMMPQRLAERAVPPAIRAQRPGKWHKVAGFWFIRKERTSPK
jgi:hypothetical protein